MNLLLITLACKLPDISLPSANYDMSCQEIACYEAMTVTVQDARVMCYYQCVESKEGDLVDQQMIFYIDDTTGCYYLAFSYDYNDSCPEW
jgi:hypothetical protein